MAVTIDDLPYVNFGDGAYIKNLEQIAKTVPTVDESAARTIAENDAKAQYPENMSATQQTSASASQISSVAEELARTAAELETLVGRFETTTAA